MNRIYLQRQLVLLDLQCDDELPEDLNADIRRVHEVYKSFEEDGLLDGIDDEEERKELFVYLRDFILYLSEEHQDESSDDNIKAFAVKFREMYKKYTEMRNLLGNPEQFMKEIHKDE